MVPGDLTVKVVPLTPALPHQQDDWGLAPPPLLAEQLVTSAHCHAPEGSFHCPVTHPGTELQEPCDGTQPSCLCPGGLFLGTGKFNEELLVYLKMGEELSHWIYLKTERAMPGSLRRAWKMLFRQAQINKL